MTIETENGTLNETVRFETLEGETWINNKGAPVEVPQTQEAEITLNTQVAAGAEWTIDVTSPDANVSESWSEIVNTGSGPVMAGKIAGSMPNSSVSVTMDTSDLEYGTTLVINATRIEDPPNSPITTLNTTAEVVAPPSATISMSDQSGDGQSVVVDSVNLSDGGFVSVHTGSQLGPTVGSTDYLEAGQHSGLEVALDEAVSEDATLYVVAHQDTNGNQQFDFPAEDDPYETEGNVAAASAAYTVESTDTPTATPTATATATPTATPTDAPATATPTETPDDGGAETTSDGGPGFGIAAAIVALLAAAFVRLRRD
ncbi:PGF-CTERM sorting domain-containing protein [Halosimplex aquaticum]